MTGKKLLVTIVILFLASLALPQEPPQSTGPEIRISEILEPIRQKHHVPALAGAIVTGQGLVARGVVGVRKAGTEIPATVEDKWHLGSDTKAMTATLIGVLVEQGKLKWDTAIEQIFPDIAADLQPELRGVTLLHLLSHRSGLPANIPWMAVSKPGTSVSQQRLECVKMLVKVRLLSSPGTAFLYSNFGYVIAGAMAEKTMSASWEDLITKLVFEPLGMKSTPQT